MTATLASIVQRALSQVGGYFPGKSPYGVWYDDVYGGNKGVYDSAAFCAMGLSWVFAMEGAADIFPMHAYTPSGVNAWKARGRWHNGTAGIRPGDILYFDMPGGPNRVSHTGLALSHWRNGVDTVEFNTSGYAGGDQRNGRTNARKRRTVGIVGYGRPDYGDGPKTPIPSGPARAEVGGVYVNRPVKDIQRLVGAAQDGSYGPDTTAKVKAWQAANGLVPDGNWGPLSDAKGFPASVSSGGSKPPRIIPNMGPGSKTGFEELWQRVLREFGYTSVGTPDGSYGPKTTQATRNYQAARGIRVDGAAGPQTISATFTADGDGRLFMGDTGYRVSLLQHVVGTGVDGSFGPATTAEVKKVQRHFGVDPDGSVGPLFARKYREAAS